MSHGGSSPMWQTTFFIWAWLSAVPTMMDMRHVRLANIFLTLQDLHITPGESLTMKINSSMSSTPNVQFLLMGSETSLTFFIAWTLWSISKLNLFFSNISTLSIRIASLEMVSSSFWETIRRRDLLVVFLCWYSKLNFSFEACWSIVNKSLPSFAMIKTD